MIISREYDQLIKAKSEDYNPFHSFNYGVLFTDGINPFNSASRTQTLLHLKETFREACSFPHQIYDSATGKKFIQSGLKKTVDLKVF